MAPLHLKLPLTEQALADLNDIIADERENTDKHPAGRWLYLFALRPSLKGQAELRNLLLERGKVTLNDGKSATVQDLQDHPMTLQSYPEGTVTIVLGEIGQRMVERTCSLIRTLNDVGGQALTWTEAREWVLETCLVEIARRKARLEERLLDEEEKELRGPPKPDAPKP